MRAGKLIANIVDINLVSWACLEVAVAIGFAAYNTLPTEFVSRYFGVVVWVLGIALAAAVALLRRRLRWALVQLLDRTYFARAQLLVEHHMRQQRQQATASVGVQVAAQPSKQTQHGNSGLRQPLLPPVPSLMRGDAR